ncbi:2-hydroxyacyl-CoA dehydratase subunit D [Alteromonas lipolytica]|uniref:Benzoyl-CoA reductase n=1 Tax=Alteromonas lipolytica TaxID=1856405 RepID=A0A1E8FD39_9ALTE|nr:2-hydroxyacyl-CoA dehydratase family protein [Alteromonas lipolytica]OFI33498.1 hypothetical protein BFC17_04365 [Alteromonas lipolytica]GGF59119.1 r-phenyllactate dehydratase small subunit [Alteromonas lipolytica]
MSETTIKDFHAAFADPHTAARAWKQQTGGQVVGCIGADVPYELITAAGMLPVRIVGEPCAATDTIAPYVGDGVDPAVRSIAERLISGQYDYVDHVIICSSPFIYSSLYEFLLESRRIHGDIGLPTPVMFDFFRSQRLTASLYNRETVQRFKGQLEEWSGNTVDDDKIRAAIATYNEQRKLLGQVNALRSGDNPTLSGTDALTANATSLLLPVEKHCAMLRELLAADLPKVSGTPVIYSGSNTENCTVYQAIEAAGALIVSDDQEFGSSASEALVDEAAENPIDALCDRLQFGPPRVLGNQVHDRADYLISKASQTNAKAVVFHILAIDHPAALDYPRLRDRLHGAAIGTTEFGPRLYNETDFTPVTTQTQDFLSELTTAEK